MPLSLAWQKVVLDGFDYSCIYLFMHHMTHIHVW